MDTLLYAALCNAVLAAGLAVVVAAARPLLRRRPALVHGLWLLVLLKLVTPPFVAVPLPWPGPGQPEAAPPAPGPAHLLALPDGPPPANVVEVPAAVPAEPPPAPEAAPAPLPHVPWQQVVLGVWLGGALLWWAAVARQVLAFRRLFRLAEPAPAEVQDQAGRLARRLGLRRCPGVWFLAAPVSPLVWALGPVPRLLLPAGLWGKLGEDQRQALLAHELAHLRRRDHWVRRLELLVLGLYWWLPVAWWARRGLREAEEQCCDAWVVWALPGAGPAYAAALVETVAYLSAARAPLPVAASGAGQVRTLKRRLTMILRDVPPRSLSAPGLLALAAVAALLLPLWPSWEQAAPAADEPSDSLPAHLSPTGKADPNYRSYRVVPAGPQKKDIDDVLRKGVRWLGRLQDTVEVAEKATSVAPARPLAPAADVQQLRDEVELAEAQVRVKQALLVAAKQDLDRVKRQLDRFDALATRGAVSREEVDEARAKVAAGEAQVRVREAELLEPEIRLRQARRRLEALQGPPRPAGTSAAPVGTTGPITLHLSEYKHDFGTVPSGGRLRWAVSLVNKSDKAIEITGVRTSAGYVRASCPKQTLAPGEKGVLEAHVDTGRFTGRKAADIYLVTSEPQTYHLQVTADSRPGAVEKKGAGGPARIQDLEKRLDELQKEIDALRKQLPTKKSAAGLPRGLLGTTDADGQPSDVLVSRSRAFKIPVNVDPARKSDLKWLILWVSRDGGQAWRVAARGTPAVKEFTFKAPESGLYWFAVTVVDARAEQPTEVQRNLSPSLKVLVAPTGQ